MQIKQVAELLGVDKKEIIDEVEARRDQYTTMGIKIAKKLTATSNLDDNLVRQIMANVDLRRQQVADIKREEDERRHRDEEERRRNAEELKRRQEEEERRAAAAEAARKAAEQLARQRAEAERLKAEADALAAAQAAAAQAAAAAARTAAAQSAPATPIEAPAPAPQAQAPAPAPAPAAPVAPPVLPPGVGPAFVAPPAAPPQPAPQAAPAPAPYQRPTPVPPAPGSAPNIPRLPTSRPGERNPYQHPPGAPGGPGQGYTAQPGVQARRDGPPREGYRGDRPPREGMPPREGGYRGDRPPREGGYRQEGGPPREGGYRGDRGPRPGGPGGPGGDRGPRPAGPGGPGGYRGPGGPGGPPREGYRGDRPPREGGRPGGPGGDRGPRPGGPGGDRGGPRPGGPGGDRGQRPADQQHLRNFVDKGITTDVTDDYRRSQPRRNQKPVTKPAEPGTGGDWREDNKPKRAAPKGVVDDKKKIRPSQIFNLEGGGLSDRRPKLKRRQPNQRGGAPEQRVEIPQGPRVVKFSGDFTVGEFAEKIGVSISDLMKKLLMSGEMLTINQLLDPAKAEELAVEFEIEIEIERESDDADIARYLGEEEPDADLRPRAPIVTVMGHVDHGKTSLLDRIRKADVAAHEFGGITQHIGAYLVQTAKGDVVFLDTPGHEAFTEMRSRGADVTDLVILVVAANDGVMPQTVEAISHAKAANVPILVAINKVDVPGANTERVKQELMKYELVPEEYGGETIMLPVSALTGQGIDELLEYVALQTEILELKANPDRSAIGTVVESHIDPLRGAVATVLVERGTLRIGDIFVCGTESGRVRAMRDDRDNALEQAGPATPVEILGFSGSPNAGEKFVVLEDEAEARDIAEKRQRRRKSRKAQHKAHISLENLAERISEEEALTLNVIIKADVQGSAEAVAGTLLKIKSDKVQIRILHNAVGAVSTSDVQLADASEAIILAFNVTTDPAARSMAEDTGVDVRSYQIIYALKEDVEKAMLGMLKPTFEEKQEGRAVVRQTFKVSKVGTVAGCFVEDGNVAISHQARLIRNGNIIWRGKLRSLRRVKDDVKQVISGLECGIGLENYNDVKEGDIIETYSMVEQTVTLMNEPSRA